jgi:polyribonucleotide nucleotidyltransferase
MEHQFKHQTLTLTIGGKELIFETGKIARHAHGAVIVRSGETILLNTATRSPLPGSEIDFLPLRVDYQEKFSSTGRTLGGFIKREGRPTEKEILTSRLIDRPLRPMFEDGYYNEVQLLSYVYSYDGIHLPEALAICGASAALCISDIPLIKPVGAVRVGLIGEDFIINPTYEEQKKSRLDLILAGTADAILMIEGFCDFLTEEQLFAAVQEGHAAITTICQGLEKWQKEIGKDKVTKHINLPSTDLFDEVAALTKEALLEASHIKEKDAREEALAEISDKVTHHFFVPGQEERYTKQNVKATFKKVQAHYMRQTIINDNRRFDGRTSTQIRPISIELGLLPRTHGSALFTRGETQAIAVCTLGGETMAQRYEDLHGDNSARFYLQYSFPPFSVGEVGRMGSPGRREIGHGKLAEKALYMTLPKPDVFPYVIRLESNITESNGSSSMASVCGGCLALMEAGVPIKDPIAGIAMGLILEGDRYVILSDILGAEDALGDMDFKVAGNALGITAFQLDIKIEGITPEIMKAALAQAKEGRIYILNKMVAVCPKPKQELSAHAPRIEAVRIHPSKIGTIIGPGGKQIRAITEETGCSVDIDETGKISLSGSSDGMERAKEIIYNLTAEVEVDKVYKGRVTGIKEFGCFVELVGGKEGLCHISELSHQRIQDVRDVVKEGDMLEVKVLEINPRGQVRLSHKALLPAPARQTVKT